MAHGHVLFPCSWTALLMAVLNPDHEVPFCPNRIVVHVSGPDITDLNFVDLPGSCLV